MTWMIHDAANYEGGLKESAGVYSAGGGMLLMLCEEHVVWGLY